MKIKWETYPDKLNYFNGVLSDGRKVYATRAVVADGNAECCLVTPQKPWVAYVEGERVNGLWSTSDDVDQGVIAWAESHTRSGRGLRLAQLRFPADAR